MCHCPLAATLRHDGNFLAVGSGACQSRFDPARRGRRVTRDDGGIAALDSVRGELARQEFVRRVGLGDDEQS